MFCSERYDVAFPIRGLTYGRARLVLQYNDSRKSKAAVHYFVLPPMQTHVQRFGVFQASRAFFGAKAAEGADPFGRAPSIMPWDRERQQHVLQDPRYTMVAQNVIQACTSAVVYIMSVLGMQAVPTQSKLQMAV